MSLYLYSSRGKVGALEGYRVSSILSPSGSDTGTRELLERMKESNINIKAKKNHKFPDLLAVALPTMSFAPVSPELSA